MDVVDAALQDPSFRPRNRAKLRDWIEQIARHVESYKTPVVRERFKNLAKSSLAEESISGATGYYDLRRSGDQYIFNLRTSNNEIILTSERYLTKVSAQRGIELVRQSSSNETNYHRKNTTNGFVFFTVVSANGQTIGRSELYSSASAQNLGIASVKINGASLLVKDNT
ncbi:hypothetical protein DDK21_27805 [Achromobacter xylosoxidans]|nr:hypothetical protein DDK21_27805 [Achromobacter xylosoxidans]